MMLEDLAPEEAIKACAWYKPQFNEKNQETITRAQRIKFAVQAGLEDDFVTKTLKVDVAATSRKYVKLIDRLNGFTHINAKTFGISRSSERQLVKEALATFVLLFRTIDDCRDKVVGRVENRARRALNFELIATSIDELHEIATHYTTDGGDIDDLALESMDDSTIVFTVEGSVDCQLQYGSDGDYERGEGLRHDTSYPLTCELVADITAPLDLEVRNLRVDNSSFYE
jgi:hypothetical protein